MDLSRTAAYTLLEVKGSEDSEHLVSEMVKILRSHLMVHENFLKEVLLPLGRGIMKDNPELYVTLLELEQHKVREDV